MRLNLGYHPSNLKQMLTQMDKLYILITDTIKIQLSPCLFVSFFKSISCLLMWARQMLLHFRVDQLKENKSFIYSSLGSLEKVLDKSKRIL